MVKIEQELFSRLSRLPKSSIFFQLINHGVSKRLMEEVLEVSKELFELPAEDKASLYSEDPNKSCRLCTRRFITGGMLCDTRVIAGFKSSRLASGSLLSLFALQVLEVGEWLAVEPLRNAFVVNLGHMPQIISNGKLKCVDHRVVTSKSVARTTIASFIHPSSNC